MRFVSRLIRDGKLLYIVGTIQGTTRIVKYRCKFYIEAEKIDCSKLVELFTLLCYGCKFLGLGLEVYLYAKNASYEIPLH